MAKQTSLRDKHMKEAMNLLRDAAFALNNDIPSDMQTVIYILENTIEEVKAVIKIDKR